MTHDGFEALFAENTRLTEENAILRSRLIDIRAVLDRPSSKARTLEQCHDLLEKQDRDRKPGELPDFSIFTR
jgi:regulator of replication initiation timing